MTVYGLFYGGNSCSPPDPEKDLEVFPNLRAVTDALRERYNSNGHWLCDHAFADGRIEHVAHLADHAAEIQVFLSDPPPMRR
ncbi:hypothetical protein [Qaidamihabitans albus]|uniref:hypothetical protein n=1 Tax=Qaidamihabitans albus TaxID=2795733 RepID=UPI0018F1DE22|nr:hypothetical protein [Qaidamihabitans albus]